MHYLLNAVDECVTGRTDNQATFSYDDGFGHVCCYTNKVIYGVHLHGTSGNHFSGTNVRDMAWCIGIWLTLTNHRDRFPTGTTPYFHYGKTVHGCPKAKAAYYNNPIEDIGVIPI